MSKSKSFEAVNEPPKSPKDNSGIYVSSEFLKKMGLTKKQAWRQLLEKWGSTSSRKGVPSRASLIAKQNGVDPITNTPIVDDGHRTHVDHIWTRKQATEAIVSGQMTDVEAAAKLWAPDNLRAVHARTNYERNRK